MLRTPMLILASSLVPTLCLGNAEPPQTTAPAARQGHILIRKEGKHVLLSPEGKPIEEFPENRKKFRLLTPDGKTVEIPLPENSTPPNPSISPNGKRVAFIAPEGRLGWDREFNSLRSVFVSNLDGKGEDLTFEIKGENLTWAPDGKLVVVEAASMKDVRARKFTTWLVDVGTKEKTKLDVPETAQIYCVTPDGKSFVATTYDFDKKQFHIVSISRESNKVSELTSLAFGIMSPTNFINPRLSPDGSRILFLDVDKEEKLEEGMRRFPRLYLYDLKTKKRAKLADVALDAFIWEYAWSPDSKRVAYVWKRMEAGVPLAASLNKDGTVKVDPKLPKTMTETETHLNVSDPDGKNSKTILSAKGRAGPTVTLMRLDWR